MCKMAKVNNMYNRKTPAKYKDKLMLSSWKWGGLIKQPLG